MATQAEIRERKEKQQRDLVQGLAAAGLSVAVFVLFVAENITASFRQTHHAVIVKSEYEQVFFGNQLQITWRDERNRVHKSFALDGIEDLFSSHESRANLLNVRLGDRCTIRTSGTFYFAPFGVTDQGAIRTVEECNGVPSKVGFHANRPTREPTVNVVRRYR